MYLYIILILTETQLPFHLYLILKCGMVVQVGETKLLREREGGGDRTLQRTKMFIYIRIEPRKECLLFCIIIKWRGKHPRWQIRHSDTLCSYQNQHQHLWCLHHIWSPPKTLPLNFSIIPSKKLFFFLIVYFPSLHYYIDKQTCK